MGPYALLALGLIPLWAVIGMLVWRNLGWAQGEHFFALRHGIVGSYHAYVPTAKVQAVVLQQGPFSQLLGLAELTVYVAGGSPTRLPDLTIGDARRLRNELALPDVDHAPAGSVQRAAVLRRGRAEARCATGCGTRGGSSRGSAWTRSC